MSYALSAVLKEAEWKKHKAALATETGISKKLRDLVGPAAAFDYTDDTTLAPLVTALKDVAKSAAEQEKKLSGAFAKTKDLLGKMAKAARDAVHEVEGDVSDYKKEQKKKLADEQKRKEIEARDEIKNEASKGADAFMQVLEKHAKTLALVVGPQIKIKQAIKAKDQEAIKELVEKHTGVKLVVGDLIKLCK